MFDKQNQPFRVPEWALLAFVLIALVINSLAFGEPEAGNPYVSYWLNAGIRRIYGAAVLIDVAIIIALLVWRVFRFSNTRRVLLALLVLAAGLPWLELWYGSTFYYGEVRDKQGLPIGVNHFGVLGTFVFLSYLAIRLPAPERVVARHALWRGAAVVAIVVVEFIAWRIAYQPWNLWQS